MRLVQEGRKFKNQAGKEMVKGSLKNYPGVTILFVNHHGVLNIR